MTRSLLLRWIPALLTVFSATLITVTSTTVFAVETSPPTWKGDFRYRIVQQKEGANQSRLYQQIRARLGLKVDIDSDFSAEFRLATASSAISTNQLLGDKADPGMPRRAFGIDQAFGTWRSPETTGLGLNVSFGRFESPFFTPGGAQLLFDADLAFEGIALGWKSAPKDEALFFNVGGFIISENYDAPVDTVDTGLIGADLGWNLEMGDLGKLTLRIARHHFLNVAGRPITGLDRNARIDSLSSPSERYRGNSVYAEDPLAATKTYLMKSEYMLTNAGFEWDPFSKDAAEDSMGLVIFGDWIQNDHGGNHRNAAETGVIVNSGALEVVVAVAFKDSDSVLGVFSDSDFTGGGTDTKGAKLGLAYQVTKHSELALTSFVGTRGVSTTARDYNGQQLDFSLRF